MTKTTITLENQVKELGDTVFVPARLPNGELKPSKIKIKAIIVTLTKTGNRVEHIGESGERLPETTYESPYDCQKAIEIMERHGKQVDQELNDLHEAIRKEKEATNGGKK